MSIAHGLTGAFLATKLGHPVLYFPAALAAHYLEDWIPHWDVGTGLSTGKRTRTTAIVLEIFDLAVTGGLIWLFWHDLGWSGLLTASLGCFAALLPDFLEAPRNFLRWEPAWLKPINNLHNSFHHSTFSMVLGLLPQVMVVLLVGWLH